MPPISLELSCISPLSTLPARSWLCAPGLLILLLAVFLLVLCLEWSLVPTTLLSEKDLEKFFQFPLIKS
jgi:hypothetical protein